jgi:hypothetical protein
MHHNALRRGPQVFFQGLSSTPLSQGKAFSWQGLVQISYSCRYQVTPAKCERAFTNCSLSHKEVLTLAKV